MNRFSKNSMILLASLIGLVGVVCLASLAWITIHVFGNPFSKADTAASSAHFNDMYTALQKACEKNGWQTVTVTPPITDIESDESFYAQHSATVTVSDACTVIVTLTNRDGREVVSIYSSPTRTVLESDAWIKGFAAVSAAVSPRPLTATELKATTSKLPAQPHVVEQSFDFFEHHTLTLDNTVIFDERVDVTYSGASRW